jgi:ribonuclease Z
LVHEVYYVDEATLRTSPEERIIVRHHTTPEQAGEIFSRVQPRLACTRILAGGTLIQRS